MFKKMVKPHQGTGCLRDVLVKTVRPNVI